MTGLIDMHMHSTASDGKLTPSRLAEECFRLGVKYCALTDHDTVGGQEEFLSRAANLGIEAVSGIEFNAEHDDELHILGYGFDIHDKEIGEVLEHLKNERLSRAGRIVGTLIKNGYLISFDRVKELAGGGVIGRPHIAQVLVEKGYCTDIAHAFSDFLSRGGAGYVRREKISSQKAISLINAAGGKAVCAHPGLMKGEDFDALFTRLKKEGLWGIEAFYSVYTDEQCSYFSDMADKYGLFVTGGTDYHGSKYNEKFPGQEKRGIALTCRTFKILVGKG